MPEPRRAALVWIRQVIAIVAKDLLVEWRAPARASAVLFFAIALVLVVAFASGATTALRRHAGGTLWVGLLLASSRSLDRSFQTETEGGALEGLVLAPIAPSALYVGKALANTLVLVLVAAVLCPIVLALFDASVRGNVALLVPIVSLGCAAIAAPGTLYGLVANQTRGASVLLPILHFPLVIPAVLAAARGTSLVLDGDPMEQANAWLGLLATFAIVHVTLGTLLFGRLLEDG
jgi:heme exporter protein B